MLTNSDPEDLRSFDLETTNTQTFYRVSRRPLPLFGAALVALDTIDLNGNSLTSDSYDSADANYSINGLYPFGQTNMINSNGDIMAGLGIVDSVGVGYAIIKGKVRTSPAGSVSVGTNGFVTGGIYDNFNVSFPDARLPIGVWLPVSNVPITVGGIRYQYKIVSNGDYLLNGLSSGLYIGSNVNCRVRITGNVNITDTNQIRISYGAAVKIYMQGAIFTSADNGVVNENGNASSLYYYGLPSNTNIQYAVNGGFVGAIYAPQASFILGGGGDFPRDFIGASVTKNVTMNGPFNFHYDENLKRIGPHR